MPHSVSARKRVRQHERRRVRNKSLRNEIKTLTKSLEERVQAKDVDGAQVLFRKVTSKLDKAAKASLYHKNATARRKSKAALLVNGLTAPAAK